MSKLFEDKITAGLRLTPVKSGKFSAPLHHRVYSMLFLFGQVQCRQRYIDEKIVKSL